ncbi:MAG: hypothetical protein ABJA49_06275 [Betaproteobacteria bacterium]
MPWQLRHARRNSTGLAVGGVIDFTLQWRDDGVWEGRDHHLGIVAA